MKWKVIIGTLKPKKCRGEKFSLPCLSEALMSSLATLVRRSYNETESETELESIQRKRQSACRDRDTC